MHEEAKTVSRKIDLTRRGFVGASLATGFALAVQPVSAETITTDTQGLEAGEVQIPVGAESIPAYRAAPATGAGVCVPAAR